MFHQGRNSYGVRVGCTGMAIGLLGLLAPAAMASAQHKISAKVSISHKAPPINTVTFATNQTVVGFLNVEVAIRHGYFAREGIHLAVTIFAGGSPGEIPILAENKIDISTMVPAAALFNATAAGFNIKLINAESTPKANYSSDAQIVVANSIWNPSAFSSPKSLVSMPNLKWLNQGANASVLDILSRQLISQGGLNYNTLKQVSESPALSLQNLEQLFRSGTVDIGSTTGINATVMQDQGAAHIWQGLPQLAPWFQDTYLAASGQFASQHPAILARFEKAILLADRYIQKANNHWTMTLLHDEEALTGLPGHLLVGGGLPYMGTYGQISEASLQRAENLQVAEGLVKSPVAPSALVDAAALTTARKALGIKGKAVIGG